MAANLLRSLTHPRQPKVSGAMRVKCSRVDALAIVTHAQLKLAGVVLDLHFNPASTRGPERFAQRLAADPIDVVADDWAEGLRRTLDRDVDCCGSAVRAVALTGRELFSECPERDREVVGDHRRLAETLHRVPPLSDRL